jgi:hypothetical protein
MCWDNAAMREDRQQAYFDSILMAVSEAGGRVTRRELVALVASDLPDMGDTAWHVGRMVGAMVRGHCLVREGDAVRLNSRPDDQLNR